MLLSVRECYPKKSKKLLDALLVFYYNKNAVTLESMKSAYTFLVKICVCIRNIKEV